MTRTSSFFLRGAAYAETIVTLGFMLTVMVGVVELAFAGYYQAELDAATFFYSHEYALTNQGPAQNGMLKTVFPDVSPPPVTTQQAPPPIEANDPNAAAVLSEYTTGGIPGGTTDSLNDRYGGASLLVPQLISTTGTMQLPSLAVGSSPGFLTPVNLLGQTQLSSGNVEGRTMVAAHDDDAPGTAFNSNASNNNLELPGVYDQNTPPYYFATGDIWMCPNGGCSSNGGGHTDFVLGLAALLQDASYSGALNGNYQNNVNGLTAGAQFYAMACHQKVFVTLVNADLPSVYPGQAGLANFDSFYKQNVIVWDRQPCGNSYGTVCPTKPQLCS